MAICQVMVAFFCKRSGELTRWYCANGQTETRYSDTNLREGIEYCYWLLEDGYTHCPMNHYNLQNFILWAKEQITYGTIPLLEE